MSSFKKAKQGGYATKEMNALRLRLDKIQNKTTEAWLNANELVEKITNSKTDRMTLQTDKKKALDLVNVAEKEASKPQQTISLSALSAPSPNPTAPLKLPENVTKATANKEKVTALIVNAQAIVDDMAKNSGKYTKDAVNVETFDPNTNPLVVPVLTLTNTAYNREGMLKLVQAYVDKAIALVIETSKLLEEPQVGGRRKSRKAKK
jgi:hypothetical protein